MARSELPTLDLYEQLKRWGSVRLQPDHLNNVVKVELRRDGEAEWKPIYMFVVVGGRVAMRVLAEKNDRILAYEPTTNTFSDVTHSSRVGNDPGVRPSEDRQDDDRGGDNS